MAAVRELSENWSALDCAKVLIWSYVLVTVLIYVMSLTFDGVAKQNPEAVIAGKCVKLLITAHPDDECMFFSPFILKTLTFRDVAASEIHLLCLTNGNYYGQGARREKEILNSCQILGLSTDHVTVINDSNLPDDPSVSWKDSSLEWHLVTAVNRIQPKQIFTFDGSGVSGHGNHIAVSRAVRNIYQDGKKFKGVEAVYYLESVSIWRKYLGIFDLPVTFLFSSHLYLLTPKDILSAQKAMLAHRSQLEWFRYLYILLSRYMVVNSFQMETQMTEEDK